MHGRFWCIYHSQKTSLVHLEFINACEMRVGPQHIPSLLSGNLKNPNTMKSALLFVGLLSIGSLQAQEGYRTVLVDDPYMCNGYFIRDVQKCRDAGVASLDVDIHVYGMVNGRVSDRVVQSFTITNELYKRVDPARVGELKPGERVYYHLFAKNAGGDVIFDHRALPVDPDDVELACANTCQAPTWAWTLEAWQNNTQATTEIVLNSATSPYGYYYFYVNYATEWAQWKEQHFPGDFGLSGSDWNYYLGNHGQVEVIKLDQNLPSGAGGAPEGAKSWLGYDIPPHTPVIGIRKDRGAYRVISATRELACSGCGGGVCDALMDYYNAGAAVQQDLALHNLSPLWCPAMPSTEGIGGEVMDSDNPFASCTGLPVPADGNLFNWMNSVLDCIGNVGNGGGGNPDGGTPFHNVTYATLLVNQWYDDGTLGKVFGVSIPDGKDPKLVQVDKTELLPGLYEFVAVLNNGQIMRHFEDFEQPRAINADFVDFINVNIYPVPVKGQEFAVDIDLLVPSQVTITIVNNMGKEYYTKTVNFDQAGRNKHVVEMGNAWPNGIYHALFQYGDGSSTTKSFSVE